jgi:hypothetical protein
VITHCATTHRAPSQFLEEIRELLALPASLPFLAKKRHVLNTVEQRHVNNFRVVPRNDFLAHTAFFGLELGDVVADNRTIAQEFVDVAFVPEGRPRVPGRDALLAQSPNDDAATVSSNVHLEYPTHELGALFEHVDFAIANFKPARHLACRDDSFFRKLALRLPVCPGSKRLVLGFTIGPHHVRKDGEECSV